MMGLKNTSHFMGETFYKDSENMITREMELCQKMN